MSAAVVSHRDGEDETAIDLEMVPLQTAAPERQENGGVSDGLVFRKGPSTGKNLHTLVNEGDFDSFAAVLRDEEDDQPIGGGQQLRQGEKLVNAQDDEGQTVLHLAVEKSDLAAIRLLSQRDDTDYTIQDCRKDTALHIAVRKQDTEALDLLLSRCFPGGSVDSIKRADVPGLNNKTPLALAVQSQYLEIVRKLLESGADPLQGDFDGMTPVGIAAIKGDINILSYFFEQAELSLHSWNVESLSRDSVGPYDASVLHLGVESSFPDIVEFLLTKPVDISAKKSDGSTALHLACANGQPEIVKLLVNYCKANDMKKEMMETTDEQDLMPIHRAATFDRDEVIAYLLDEESDIEVKLEDGATLLLVAVKSGSSKSSQLLLRRGADPLAKDLLGQGIFHRSVSHSRTLQALIESLGSTTQKLINLQDSVECTALHYAAEGGFNQAVSLLLDEKADAGITNSRLELPLHMGVSNGHLLVVMSLANHTPKLIDVKNISGQTGLHLGCMNGHINVVDYLLQMGAAVSSDDEGRTPLHYACESGSLGCLELLLDYWKSAIDVLDGHKDTALHLASKGDHPHLVTLLLDRQAFIFDNEDEMNPLDVALENQRKPALHAIVENDRWRELMKLQGDSKQSQLQLLMEASPQAAKKLLDNCISTQNQPEEANYKTIYDFSYLQGVTDKDATITFGQSMATLRHMVERKCEICLQHPVSVTFLNSKWRRLGWTLYIFNLLVYSTFLALLTAYVVGFFTYPHCDTTGEIKCHRDTAIRYLILAFSILNLLKELSQIWSNHIFYFLEFTNILEWALYVTAILFMNPGGVIFTLDSEGCCPSSTWVVGAVSIFFAWMNMVLFWKRFAQFGLYVVMISAMVLTLLKVIAVVALLVFSYGVVFLLLFRNKTEFKDLGVAVLKSFTMTLGDFEYTSILPAPNQNLSAHSGSETDLVFFDGPSYFMFICFALSMIIIVSNLLIGLAVGDIGEVQKGAVIERLSMQVTLIADMEDGIPKYLGKYLKHCIFTEVVIHPNQTGTMQKLFVSHVVDNVSTEEAEEETDENEQEVRKLTNLSENMVEKTKSLALRLDRQMDLLMSLTNTLSKYQGVTGDVLEEDDDDDDDQRGVDIAAFVARAGAVQRAPPVTRAMEGDWGEENDYV